MLLAVVEASLIPETMALANTLTAPYRATVRWWQAEDMTQLTCTPPSAAYYGTSCWESEGPMTTKLTTIGR